LGGPSCIDYGTRWNEIQNGVSKTCSAELCCEKSTCLGENPSTPPQVITECAGFPQKYLPGCPKGASSCTEFVCPNGVSSCSTNSVSAKMPVFKRIGWCFGYANRWNEVQNGVQKRCGAQLCCKASTCLGENPTTPPQVETDCHRTMFPFLPGCPEGVSACSKYK